MGVSGHLGEARSPRQGASILVLSREDLPNRQRPSHRTSHFDFRNMLNRGFSVTIVLFWLSTMTWLVLFKVLPPLMVGEPPNYVSVLAEMDQHAQAPSKWRILLDGESIGSAETWMEPQDEGISHIHSRVKLRSPPSGGTQLSGLALIENLLHSPGSSFELEAKSRFEIDPLGRLVVFETTLGLGAHEDAVRLRGTVEGNNLRLQFSSGDFVHNTTVPLASNGLVGDGFSPRDRLPGLRVGQKWTVPIYSPFRSGTDPMEILEAVVDRRETVDWNGRRYPALLVIYRRDAGAGLQDAEEPRAKIWVLADGLVVRQEAMLMGSWIQFVRESSRGEALAAGATNRADSSGQ